MDRVQLLARLESGDFFHAAYPGREARLLCLVLSVTDKTIRVRRITSQETLEYDRRSGEEISGGEGGSVITSVAPLPLEHHNTLLDLDRIYRLGQGDERFKASDAQKKTLLFVGDHYDAAPLPP
jgi:hypothetical protein